MDFYFIFYSFFIIDIFNDYFYPFPGIKLYDILNILFKTCILICPSRSTEIPCCSFSTGNLKGLLLGRHMCLLIKNHWVWPLTVEEEIWGCKTYSYTNEFSENRGLFQTIYGTRSHKLVFSKHSNGMNSTSVCFQVRGCLSITPAWALP